MDQRLEELRVSTLFGGREAGTLIHAAVIIDKPIGSLSPGQPFGARDPSDELLSHLISDTTDLAYDFAGTLQYHHLRIVLQIHGAYAFRMPQDVLVLSCDSLAT
jgi:hypothetical protein